MGRIPFSRSFHYFLIALIILTITLYFKFFFYTDAEGNSTFSFGSPTPYCNNVQQAPEIVGEAVKFPEVTPTTKTITVTTTATATLTPIPTLAPVLADAPNKNLEPAYCNYCTSTDELCKRYGSFNLARSRAYEGPNARLKRVIRKLRSGQKIKIGIIGGSVSKGHGLTDRRHNWSHIYAEYIRETFAKSTSSDAANVEVELINGSVGATVSEYMETCFSEHIPKDVDLVIIELAINDQRLDVLAKGYENLIRAIFALPLRPAIINVQVMALMFATITMGGDLHTAIAEYYDTPVISIRNVILPHILRSTQLDSSDTSVEDYWFEHDSNGIDLRHLGLHGHRMLGDLLSSFTSRVACEAWREEQLQQSSSHNEDPTNDVVGGWDWAPYESDRYNGLTPSLPNPNEGESVSEYIPRQSLFQKYDHTTILRPATPFCRTTNTLAGTAYYSPYAHLLEPLPAPLSTEGPDAFAMWSHPQNPGKVWLTAKKPGVKAAFNVQTSALGRVRVTYLRSGSYGLGSVWCWLDDNREKGKRLDGYWTLKDIHVANTHAIVEDATPGEHILHCEIMKETKDPGGGTEFRIVAVDAL
ncbi:capsule structure designer protein [Lentinula edodes]|uniref:Capsule structure designer protein n=1 Tax=Lentinula edodes TaxID=5353 RepID=A0A1Q3EPV0_LENED|nr:capsule structure designer protein [Lentinula edodes]